MPEHDHQANNHLWLLLGGPGRTWTRACEVEADESRPFRCSASAFVQLMKRSFPWVAIFPKLRIFLHSAAAYMECSRRVGLYGEQAVESWYAFLDHNAAKYSAGTAVGSRDNFVRAMGVAREASASNLVRTTRRDPGKKGARTARTSEDKRLR